MTLSEGSPAAHAVAPVALDSKKLNSFGLP
jgi:hypothetical protein